MLVTISHSARSQKCLLGLTNSTKPKAILLIIIETREKQHIPVLYYENASLSTTKIALNYEVIMKIVAEFFFFLLVN